MAVNGKRLSPAKLLAKLNDLGGKHGIGRVDLLENRYVGMKRRGVYETPGGTILARPTAASSRSPWTAKSCTCATRLIPATPSMIYNGYWFSPERRDAADPDRRTRSRPSTARPASSCTRGTARVVGRDSATDSLFNVDFATFEKDQVYNQADAEGFIKLNALRMRIAAIQRENLKKGKTKAVKAAPKATEKKPAKKK